MSGFLFGAECVEDVCAFLMAVSAKFRIKSFQFSQGEFFSDLEGEIDVDSTLAELAGLELKVDDGHAIVESLREEGDGEANQYLYELVHHGVGLFGGLICVRNRCKQRSLEVAIKFARSP